MQVLDQAVHTFEQALRFPAQHQWQAVVRQQLHGLDQALTAEHTATTETWLHARARHLHHERTRLQRRLDRLAGSLGEATSLEPLRQELMRLLRDIQHHHQRVNDLAYDAVARDVGGSE